MRKARGKIFILSGPSGSGKTTLLEKLLQARPLKNKLTKSTSFTTRPPRSKERQGRDYFFISQKQFLRYRRQKKILEWTRYLGYDYGTPRDFVEEALRKNESVLLCLDYRGVVQVRRIYPGVVTTIFILPPSLTELHQRIRQRCSKTCGKEIRLRLAEAKKELALAAKYDYSILNHDLKNAVRQLKKIILSRLSN